MRKIRRKANRPTQKPNEMKRFEIGCEDRRKGNE